MKPITTYQAFDGKRFDDEAECRDYEAAHRPLYWPLIGLTADEVREAWTNPVGNDLAQSIISLGYALAASRRNQERSIATERANAPSAEAQEAAPESEVA